MTDPAPPAGPAAARERYGAALRRGRIRYYSAIAVGLLVLAVFVGVVWANGEIANTTLHTVTRAPLALPLAEPSTTQQEAWQTRDRAALGSPQWLGTVVVYSAHTVRGLNARTGAQTWSYTRSDRTTCSTVQTNGTTFAVFRVNGNCDEVTALDSTHGTRRWTRTLDQDGLPLNGTPTVSVLPYTVMFATQTVIYAIDPGSGYNRWVYSIPGCTIERAILGTAGALISQSCTTPKCATLRYCSKGPQLLMRDGSQGRDDKDQVNPDKILWAKRGDTRVPVSADSVTAVLSPSTGVLDVLAPSSGASVSQIAVPPQAGSPSVITAATDSAELIYLHGVVYAVGAGRTEALWSLAAPTAPTTVDPSGQSDPALATARIAVGTTSGVAEIDGTSGEISRSADVPAPGTGALVRPMGTGYLVSGPTGTVAYR